MATVDIQATINLNDLPLIEELLKRLKVKDFRINKNETKLSKEYFSKMLSEAEKRKSDVKVSNKTELSNLFKSL